MSTGSLPSPSHHLSELDFCLDDDDDDDDDDEVR